MAIVLRFVDIKGVLFFDLVHVKNTKSLTLKAEICNVLSHHGFDL
jgi:hypothetical protein